MTNDQIIRKALKILEARLHTNEGGFLASPRDAANFVVLKLAGRRSEVFALLLLDTRHNLIAFREMFQGTIDGAVIHPREVVMAVLEMNAAAVVLVHNHPSGNPEPSEADRAITIKLAAALSLIDVRVLDHLVVGRTQTVSLAERGWI
jgi:DNA repair protein RadC